MSHRLPLLEAPATSAAGLRDRASRLAADELTAPRFAHTLAELLEEEAPTVLDGLRYELLRTAA
jgi:hypothetical protein